jgi:hypothetical protein
MMKQKAGLGKKVSSIFDGVALPNIARPTEQAPPQVPPAYRPTDMVSPPRSMQSPLPMPPKTSAIAAPQPPRIMPSQHSGRPVSTGVVSDNSWQQSIYKKFFSGNSETDARNKKAIMMVGLLSVMLVVVLMGTGVFSNSPSRPAASTVAAAAASSEARIDWTPPEPYPSNLRDPMQVGSVSKVANGGDSASTTYGGFAVKSIVFSADNPTAVINGQIVKVGKTINGAIVTKINKDSVEFTANGKSWKQQVE